MLILPQLPGTLTLAFLTLFACVLAFIPVKTVRYIALTLLFSFGAYYQQSKILWAGETLTGATQDAIVEITATDGMTTHYGQITHLQGRRIFPASGLVMYGEYLPQAVCAGQQWSMKLKVRAVHGQLNDGGFDSQRYAIAQHQPLTGRFLQASVIEPNCSLRAQYLASLQTTLQPYPWNAVILGLGMGNGYPSQRNQKYHARYWNGAFNGDIGMHIGFCGVAGCRTHSQWTNFSAWALDPLANTINGGICCAAFYAWLTGMQPPALRTMVAACYVGMLKLSGRQWSGWDVWICVWRQFC
ncbi:putative competence-related protein [Escherichia coli]|uniref:Putative competence-related protein n=1 Tax=Escherichia coli TaxID=562 RepID=A0A377AVJ3_ECOLX|nr:putative competence-related protein [Escherichia coli]